MNTPIVDFVTEYQKKKMLRLHMPGHKGKEVPEDITEVKGADSLYEAAGIIAQSEANATRLFGHPTFYSTEGSSQCIRAMLYLAVRHAVRAGKTPKLLACRNAHRTFLSGVALLDVETRWLYGTEESYLCCNLTPDLLEAALQEHRPTAVYLTTPDYPGNILPLAPLAELCHRYGALLLVDNAHGAYLKFLSPSRHPLDQGVDLCCDSAHKTLSVLTGGAYLHTTAVFADEAKDALSLFGSSSPSYLILQSLDKANAYLADGYPARLAAFCEKVAALGAKLRRHGYTLWGNEPLKLTLCPKSYGYTGEQLAEKLREQHIEAEFADPDFVVLMFTPAITDEELLQVEQALLSLPPQPPIESTPPRLGKGKRILSVRQAIFAPDEVVPVAECEGRVLAAPQVACPPAVPIVVSGEQIDKAARAAFAYYGITEVRVVKE